MPSKIPYLTPYSSQDEILRALNLLIERSQERTADPEPDISAMKSVFAAMDRAADVPLEGDLEGWWMDTANSDLVAAMPKIAEYGGAGEGSADLRVMGDALAELCGMADAPGAVKLELACWFYALGKVSRLISDYKQGKPGKPDSWHDLTVYSMMARRIQEVGQWP